MQRALRQLRTFFAAREDPYVGGSLPNAGRLGAVIWSLLLALAVALIPLSPPVEAIGMAGWPVLALILGANLALVGALRRGRIDSWPSLLAICYVSLFAIAALAWLAGGIDTGYEALMALPVIFAGAVHPPRKTALLLLVALVLSGAPLFYDDEGFRESGHLLADFVIWCALAVVASLMMSGVRVQRLAQAEASELAHSEARLDPLTGLYNRRAFDEILAREVERARVSGAPLTLAMVDVINFKQINDRWGYAAGDECLRAIATSLRESFREPDLCFRWGGDEFALVLTGPVAAQASAVTERVVEGISDTCHRPDDVAIEARIAATELGAEMGPRELVERAGQALADARTAALE